MRKLISRRRFLRKSSTAVGATASLLAVRRTDGGESTRPSGRIRRAVKFHMIQERLPVVDKFKLLKDLGFEGTEIHVTEKVDKEEVRRAIDATGVVVHGFLNSSKPDLKFAIDRAKFYGATSVLVVAGRVTEDSPYDQVYRQQQQRIKAALPYAEQTGVKLLIENVWNNFLLSPLEMARFIDELESPAAGAYFDVGNVVRFGWPDHWIRILGHRIVKLDIKGYSRKKQMREGPRKGFDVAIGEGDCNWPAVRQALADVGYTSGWATAEVRGGDRRRLAEIAEQMDRVLQLTADR
ncbi:MAG: sugar phosphate isomerase/epimerase family protein [Pirellulales bacterium]